MRKLLPRIDRSDWWTAFFSGVVAVTAVVALWYAHSQITEAHDEAQIQHLLTLVHEFDQDPIATYRITLAKKRLKNTKVDEPYELYRMLDFYETVGRLVDRGYLNEEDVWNQFGYWILNLDADSVVHKPLEDEMKRHPTEYKEYGDMVKRLKEIDASHGGDFSRLTPQDVTDFYDEESTIVPGKE
jgi:hypothetical protein